MFISEAFAQTAGMPAADSVWGTVIQLSFIFIIFYFLLIRPYQKKAKEHESMVLTLKKGDNIITGGGIYAKVISAEGNTREVMVEIASGIQVKIARDTIRAVIVPQTQVANDIKPKKKAFGLGKKDEK